MHVLSSSSSYKSYKSIEDSSLSKTNEASSKDYSNKLVDTDLIWTPEEEIQNKHLVSIIEANAISDNLAADLGMDNDSINTGIAIYHFVFTVCTLPSNVIATAVGAHLWIPTLMSSWAIVTWAHALISDFKGFITVRILIAITEAGFIPACLSYMSKWYKINELATRLAWFWGAQALASAVSGLISFGVFRMRGIYGLAGWKWLFIIDGIATHIVGLIAFFYLPESPANVKGGLRGPDGWLTKRQIRIATLRVIRDDTSKKDHDKSITSRDIRQAITDTNLSAKYNQGCWIFHCDCKSIDIGLTLSILIAKSSDKRGNIVLHALIGSAWGLIGFCILEILPDSIGRWQLYAVALFTASSPSWHGMQIAWMSSNIAPIGKRTLALAAVIEAANINGVPGSQIYLESDAPRYRHGNKINMLLHIITILLFVFQRTKYNLVNKWRQYQWRQMTDFQQKIYRIENESLGNDQLDFKYRL
ncbi:hypothetical protein [Parasitella parasitica]|uniref:Major facilitator superfamily (MFS) profile domain-containing protein n=1 Tax=Parasitella parasitica TaxID=35722 RepID=A0A0B7MXA5_9FUNG|nr:hypothetical protein [Parasitella parasitica]